MSDPALSLKPESNELSKCWRIALWQFVLALWQFVLMLSVLLSIPASAHAQLPKALSSDVQLPDAPSVLAPLKRYTVSFGLDNKYSVTTNLYDVTSHVGISIRLSERETIGLSFSHATVMNDQHMQNNSVSVSTNFRVYSWGKIPR